jgi:hypothetical protein
LSEQKGAVDLVDPEACEKDIRMWSPSRRTIAADSKVRSGHYRKRGKALLFEIAVPNGIYYMGYFLDQFLTVEG